MSRSNIRSRIIIVLCAAAFIPLLASAVRPTPEARDGGAAGSDSTPIVVVSIDAMANRFLDRDSLPNFRRLIAAGVRAPFVPEFPSKTFPNHYSMVTGLTPGEHGIVANTFYDAGLRAWFTKSAATDGRWFGGEPVWITAERAGLRTATFFWPGSEAKIDGGRPTYYEKFDPAVADSTKIRQVMAWLRLPVAQRPRLVFVYVSVVDVNGHRFGPDAPQTRAAVRAADATVGALADSLATLPRASDLIVVSDHGLAGVTPDRLIYLDGLLPAHGIMFDNEHATAAIYADSVGPHPNFDSLATALRPRLLHARVFRPDDLPARWQTNHNPRFGDVLLLADPGYEFATRVPRSIPTAGEHGYDPASPLMTGIFVAHGPDFRSGVLLGPRENRTLHDLLLRLLHLGADRSLDTLDYGLRR